MKFYLDSPTRRTRLRCNCWLNSKFGEEQELLCRQQGHGQAAGGRHGWEWPATSGHETWRCTLVRVRGAKKNIVSMHYFLACRYRPCILKMRIRFEEKTNVV